MTGEKPDGFMMIGLHKLAAGNGDGFIPELYELLARESRREEENPTVTEFPVWETRPPAREIPFAAPGAAQPEASDNVIAFPGRAGAISSRRKESA